MGPLGPTFYREDTTLFTEANYEKLKSPIDPARVKQREGSGGKSLSYIEAHDAIRTANEVFGIGSWGYTVDRLEQLGEPEAVSRNGRNGFRVGYRAVVEVTIRHEDDLRRLPLTFSDVGYGDAVDYSGSAIAVHELAMKEAVSDGVKRALKNLGSQFGLDLYSESGRAQIARRGRLTTPAAMKQEVWKIAKTRLEKDKPTAADVAKLFNVKPVGALADEATLRTILEAEGLL